MASPNSGLWDPNGLVTARKGATRGKHETGVCHNVLVTVERVGSRRYARVIVHLPDKPHGGRSEQISPVSHQRFKLSRKTSLIIAWLLTAVWFGAAHPEQFPWR